MATAVVLLSGGVDSSTLLHYVNRTLGKDRLFALSFRYGQRHVRELEAAAIQAASAGVTEHRILDISAFGALTRGGSVLTDPDAEVPPLSVLEESERSQPPTYVPNRNMMLLSFAAAYAEAQQVCDVYYGAQAQDEYGYWDCTTEFLTRINHLLALNRRDPVTIHAPFVDKTKADVIRIGAGLGVDFGKTWTCYRGDTTPCGVCPSCAERARGFADAGISDPLAPR